MKHSRTFGAWGAMLAIMLLAGPMIAGARGRLAEKQLAQAAKPAATPAFAATIPAGDEGVKAGEAAPPFTLKDATGKEHALASAQGKTVVLIWVNAGCPFIERHEQEKTFQALAAQFPADKVQFFLIDSTDTNPAAAAALAPATPHMVNLLDHDTAVAREYGARTTPHVFVIDPQGKVAYAGAIDNDPQGKMKPEAREPYAAEAIKAVMDGQAPKVTQTKPYGCSVRYQAPEAKPKVQTHTGATTHTVGQ